MVDERLVFLDAHIGCSEAEEKGGDAGMYSWELRDGRWSWWFRIEVVRLVRALERLGWVIRVDFDVELQHEQSRPGADCVKGR